LPANTACNILKLAIVVPSTAAIYFFAAKFLKIEMLDLIKTRKTTENLIK